MSGREFSRRFSVYRDSRLKRLSRAAKLENRKQAYAQLQGLQKEGYISGETMAAAQPNRPPTLLSD